MTIIKILMMIFTVSPQKETLVVVDVIAIIVIVIDIIITIIIIIITIVTIILVMITVSPQKES